MVLTWKVFAMVLPAAFLAGFVDSIAGGGGLISLPFYMMAGIPAHMSVATNKLMSSLGTSVATIKYARQKLINWKATLPGVVAAVLGSQLGARISLQLDDAVIRNALLVVLPVVAFIVLNRKWFHDNEPVDSIPASTMVRLMFFIFLIGMYDGFYGPGTGTFLIIVFTMVAKMSMAQANGCCKFINLVTNVSALLVYLMSGNVILSLGLAAAACNMLGNAIGASLAIRQGAKIVRPIILVILAIFLLKLIAEMI